MTFVEFGLRFTTSGFNICSRFITPRVSCLFPFVKAYGASIIPLQVIQVTFVSFMILVLKGSPSKINIHDI